MSPELMLRPSLSDIGRRGAAGRAGGVAGAYAPAFVERPPGSRCSGKPRASVAGAYAPAFVERTMCIGLRSRAAKVSPELMLRPSLSAGSGGRSDTCSVRVSPELMLRPSLSGPRGKGQGTARKRVAGAYAPAFVERGSRVCVVVAGSVGCRRSLCSGLR